MIEFKNIKYKNFMSIGNSGIDFDFTKSTTNLIIGKNGSSKSSILDAICFSLFGKAHRNINKNQLINSVNQKKCLVEIIFSIGSIEYKIIRGLKPNIFEIYQNGILMNKNSDIRDYQKILEQQILKLNYKTFTQVVILGSASFTPFMQLSPGARREVIEDILDIGVFSLMSQINKEKSVLTKEEILKIENDLKLTITLLETQKKIIKNLTESHQTETVNIQDKILKNNNEITQLNEEYILYSTRIIELQNSIIEYSKVLESVEKLKKEVYKKENQRQEYNSKILFFENNEICPTCTQQIEHSHKDSIQKEMQDQINYITELNIKINLALEDFVNKLNEMDKCKGEIQTKNIRIGSINSSINLLKKLNIELTSDLDKVQNDTSNIESEKTKKIELATTGIELQKRKGFLIEQKNIENIAAVLFKDNGIKTKIIKEYLPIINSTINKYLDKMDFFVKFELDESFNETIKSRYRDEFTYPSFSEGEKQKLDISILLAWRYIAKMKNSVNTNMLFLDEVLNSNLDSNSVDLLLEILEEIKKDSNIFVITHNTENIIDKFERVIKFEKVGNFSSMKEF